jgi:hypothetical protein
LAEKTEVLGENLPQRHFIHHTSSHMTFEPGPLRWEASDEPLELWRGLTLPYLSQQLLAVGLYNSGAVCFVRYNKLSFEYYLNEFWTSKFLEPSIRASMRGTCLKNIYL